MSALLSCQARPLEFDFESVTTIRVALHEALPNGALVRFHFPSGAELRWAGASHESPGSLQAPAVSEAAVITHYRDDPLIARGSFRLVD